MDEVRVMPSAVGRTVAASHVVLALAVFTFLVSLYLSSA